MKTIRFIGQPLVLDGQYNLRCRPVSFTTHSLSYTPSSLRRPLDMEMSAVRQLYGIKYVDIFILLNWIVNNNSILFHDFNCCCSLIIMQNFNKFNQVFVKDLLLTTKSNKVQNKKRGLFMRVWLNNVWRRRNFILSPFHDHKNTILVFI